MRTFLELKNYSKQQLEIKNLTFSVDNAHFQVYQSEPTQLNISIDDFSPVIKFEERTPEVFTISVAFNGDCEWAVDYARSKDFPMSDSITKLIDAFPDGHLIDDVVSVLLRLNSDKK